MTDFTYGDDFNRADTSGGDTLGVTSIGGKTWVYPSADSSISDEVSGWGVYGGRASAYLGHNLACIDVGGAIGHSSCIVGGLQGNATQGSMGPAVWGSVTPGVGLNYYAIQTFINVNAAALIAVVGDVATTLHTWTSDADFADGCVLELAVAGVTGNALLTVTANGVAKGTFTDTHTVPSSHLFGLFTRALPTSGNDGTLHAAALDTFRVTVSIDETPIIAARTRASDVFFW